jgi:uncharacterized protein YndB with AHSA1/START domain
MEERMFPAEHIHVCVAKPPADVYLYASNPENLPQWATGLSGSSIKREGETWVCESPMGRVKIKFAPRNELGVMDPEVTLSNGQTFHKPFRVLKNGEGSELVFTLYRQPAMTDKDYATDKATIEKDLALLKERLESSR